MGAFSSTERLKRRYLLVHGERKDIEHALLEYLGLLGWSRAAPVFLAAGSRQWIIAVERKELIHVRAALGLSTSDLEIIRVSGTLRGLGVRSR